MIQSKNEPKKPSLNDFNDQLQDLISLKESLNEDEKRLALDIAIKKLVNVVEAKSPTIKGTKILPICKRKYKSV